DRVARRPDHALHEVLLGVPRVGEYDDVAAARRLEPRQPRVGPRNRGPVDCLVDEQEVTGEQRTLHAARGDLKGFDEEGLDDEEEDERHAERTHPAVEPAGEPRPALLGGGEGNRRDVRPRPSAGSPRIMHSSYSSRAVCWAQRSRPTLVPLPICRTRSRNCSGRSAWRTRAARQAASPSRSTRYQVTAVASSASSASASSGEPPALSTMSSDS